MPSRSNEVFVLKRNVVGLVPTPLPLEENGIFTLDLRIEQDPMKVFPFQEMCTDAALRWIQENYTEYPNLQRDQLVPYGLQLRGLWELAIEPDLPRNSVHKNLNPDMPASPEANLGFASLIDQWYATRAFRVHVRIALGDAAFVHVLQPDNPEVIVRHQGQANGKQAGYTPLPLVPERPYEACYAYSEHEDAEVTEAGGGPNYDFEVSWDGHCICNVHVSASQPIHVSVHVEQARIHCPGGWGVNLNTEVDWYNADVDGSRLCRMENTVPFRMGYTRAGMEGGGAWPFDDTSLAGGLGAYVAGLLMAWQYDAGEDEYFTFGLGQPRSTPWQAAPSYSVDTIGYDWADVGSINRKHYLHMLGYGFSMYTAHELFDPETISSRIVAYVRCPALVGAALAAVDEFGNPDGIQPLTAGFFRAASRDGAPTFEVFIDMLERWYAAAKLRLATYETVVEPPKIKITATYSADVAGMEIPETTKYYYANLPHKYFAQSMHRGFEDIYTYVEPDLYNQTKENLIFQIPQQASDDRFSYAEIHDAVLNCVFHLDREGFSADWVTRIIDFEGESTIPETGFYEGPDTYIWFMNDGQIYQEWLGVDDGGGGFE